MKGNIEMAIASAVHRNGYVFVYDEKGRQLCTIATGTATGDGLQGYTSSTVSVRRGACIFTYNEKGRQLTSIPAR
jgi:hypothetical protein